MVTTSIEQSIYHRTLRVSAVVVAFVLLFESGLIVESTATMAHNTHLYLAQSVGMSASVQPTDLNQITAELTKQQQLLDAREAALRDREVAVQLNESGVSNDRATFLIAGLLFVLLVLILLNYVLDYLRSRPVITSQKTV